MPEKAKQDKQQSRNDKQQERKDIARAERLEAAGAHIVFEAIKREGVSELERSNSALAFSAIAAGLSMGFSMLAETALAMHLPAAAWTPLVSKFGYAVGFVIVILGRQQLFTENTLTPILPLLDRKSDVRLRDVLRLWGIVLGANMVGAAIFAFALAHFDVFDPSARAVLRNISIAAYQGGDFWSLLLRGIYAGWLVALIVWLMPAAENARVWVITGLAYLIGVAGFPHIVAGSIEVLYGVATGLLRMRDAVTHYMAPALIGNMAGGLTLVAALNYAQVAAGKEEE